jgi:hypothetical protein
MGFMTRPVARLIVVAALAGSAGVFLNVACSGEDSDLGEERPEPAPTVFDGGSGDAPVNEAGGATCPGGPPKVGETCPRPETSDETCIYTLGTCTKEGSTYDHKVGYRCHQGTWHQWDIGGSPCD